MRVPIGESRLLEAFGTAVYARCIELCEITVHRKAYAGFKSRHSRVRQAVSGKAR